MNPLLILKVIAGELNGQEFVFSSPSHFILGRSRTCSLRLPADPSVSRQHCLIEVTPEGVWAQDLASLNGTFINGDRIGVRQAPSEDATVVQGPRQFLKTGDELRICRSTFVVELHDRASPTTGQCLSEWDVVGQGSSFELGTFPQNR